MKILIIPSIKMKSGTGIRLRGIAKALRNRGHEVKIAESVKERMLKVNADVIFASKALPNSCVPAMFKGCLKVLDIDDLEWDYWRGSMLMLPFYFSDKLFPRFFDLITTHTKALKDYIIYDLNTPKEKLVFLPQGIDLDMFKGIKWKPEGNKIIYMAHLGVASRDLEIIFKVMKKVKATLQVIGDGSFYQHYKDLAKKMKLDIEFLGYIEHEDIPKIVSKASVAVNYLGNSLANHYRSSIKVREYLAVGIPTVSNIIGDISLFENYVYGFKTGELKEFENQIKTALKSPDKNKSRKGKLYIRKWDWNEVIDEFDKKLRSIV